MIAFKCTTNSKCKKITFEAGKEYKLIKGEIGFHFCKNFNDINEYYELNEKNTKIFEVEILGKIISKTDKSITNHIKIIREIPRSEWETFSNGKAKCDTNGNLIYYENNYGFWEKKQFDQNNNEIYYENNYGYWEKSKFDKNNNQIYFENSFEYWEKRKYDQNNNQIYLEDSNGFWEKRKYDQNNNEIYYEDSYGRREEIQII